MPLPWIWLDQETSKDTEQLKNNSYINYSEATVIMLYLRAQYSFVFCYPTF
jgi:hypothetical protein